MFAPLLRYPLIAFTILLAPIAGAAQVDIAGPSAGLFGRHFGEVVKVLPNGNIVVTDPSYSVVGKDNLGAVYLYSPAGTLISTLTGSTQNDQVGLNGVTVLANGNFVISSPQWNNGAITKAGAVTWGNQTTGVNGVVSAANSLVGGTASDFVGQMEYLDVTGNQAGPAITPLPDGSYVIRSYYWHYNGQNYAGAVTRASGTQAATGLISAANSLIGTHLGEGVGSRGLTVLANGHYVVATAAANNNANVSCKAVTWVNGTTGLTGAVTENNSLMMPNGSASEAVIRVLSLANGHYAVCFPYWNNGPLAEVGAVTWGNGLGGTVGMVTEANSLVGTSTGDRVGEDAVALTNGNYVVLSTKWKFSGMANAGSVTWCDGSGPTEAVVSPANSLVGTEVNSGQRKVTPLTNGNYVITGPWRNGSGVSVGAVTWANGTTGIQGTVTEANSLVGSTNGDSIGSGGVTALTNGNYVVCSPFWSSAGALSTGAATWCNGGTGRSGVVTAANSLTGTVVSDEVGKFGAVALTNGNYVVRSPMWKRSGVITRAGAATWGNGATGTSGPVTETNSLVGGAQGTEVSGGPVTALTNGNYVVGSPKWNAGAGFNIGAVTWGSGTAGVSGEVSSANSLVGDNISDELGNTAIIATGDGNYWIRSTNFRNPGGSPAGAITLGDGHAGSRGGITATNSVVGETWIQGHPLSADYDPHRGQLVVGQPSANKISLLADPVQGGGELVRDANGHAALRFNGPAGQNKVIQRSTDLTSWTPEWTVRATATGILHLKDTAAPAGKAFYRVKP